MTTYKIETNSNGEIFVVALHGLTTGQNCGGPYKNEESAKRRIRDLKRRDAETAITVVEAPNTATDIMNELMPASASTPRPSPAIPRPANITAAQQLSINHNDLKAFMSRPSGVYPAVAKKFYRQQWR